MGVAGTFLGIPEYQEVEARRNPSDRGAGDVRSAHPSESVLGGNAGQSRRRSPAPDAGGRREGAGRRHEGQPGRPPRPCPCDYRHAGVGRGSGPRRLHAVLEQSEAMASEQRRPLDPVQHRAQLGHQLLPRPQERPRNRARARPAPASVPLAGRTGRGQGARRRHRRVPSQSCRRAERRSSGCVISMAGPPRKSPSFSGCRRRLWRTKRVSAASSWPTSSESVPGCRCPVHSLPRTEFARRLIWVV